MKELEPTRQLQDNTEHNIRFPKTLKGIGEVSRPHAGMKLYCVPIEGGTIDHVKEVKPKVSSMPVVRDTKNKVAKNAQLVLKSTEIHHQVVNDEKMHYCWAINKKNAFKKYKKHYNLP